MSRGFLEFVQSSAQHRLVLLLKIVEAGVKRRLVGVRLILA